MKNDNLRVFAWWALVAALIALVALGVIFTSCTTQRYVKQCKDPCKAQGGRIAHKAAYLILLILLPAFMFAQHYDTSLYKEYRISKIEHSMKLGGPGFRFTLEGSDTIYVYRRTTEGFKAKQRILVSKVTLK